MEVSVGETLGIPRRQAAVKEIPTRNDDIANGITVDAKPHEAYEDQNQMLNDIWENNKIIARSLLKKYGIEASYLSNPTDVARFNTERDLLHAEGKLLPGLNGL